MRSLTRNRAGVLGRLKVDHNFPATAKAKIIFARVIFFNKSKPAVDALLVINMIMQKTYAQALWATYKDLYKAA